MKKIIMVLMTAMFMGTAAMAQEQQADKSAMIQKRTESVAKRYGLDDAQAKKLLELNTKYSTTMATRFGQRGGRGGNRPQMGKNDSTARKRPEMTQEQKTKMEEGRKKMQESMAAYDKELQDIMTADQYKSYKADAQQRMSKRDGNRKEAR